jgi:hypothetical protein
MTQPSEDVIRFVREGGFEALRAAGELPDNCGTLLSADEFNNAFGHGRSLSIHIASGLIADSESDGLVSNSVAWYANDPITNVINGDTPGSLVLSQNRIVGHTPVGGEVRAGGILAQRASRGAPLRGETEFLVIASKVPYQATHALSRTWNGRPIEQFAQATRRAIQGVGSEITDTPKLF